MGKSDKKKQQDKREQDPQIDIKDGEQEQDSEELQAAQARITELEDELAAARDKHLRSVAELENFKRRTEKEKAELSGHVKSGVFRDILGVVDDFERFFQHVENSQAELDESFVQGVEMMHKTLQKSLERHGVEPVNETGVPVDYNIHEAVMTEPVDDEDQDQTVLDILEVGYRIGDRLIRPARVKVGVYNG